jgi:hypothetical protein
MVTAGAFAAGAYIAAGDPPQYAAAAFAGQAGETGPAGDIAQAGRPVQETDGTGGTSAGGTAGGTLSAESRVAALRSRGWACPDLHAMGFHVVSATSKIYAGRPAVELHLSDGTHTATVLEQHPTANGGTALQGTSTEANVPVNPLTGHAAIEDGFVAVDGSGDEGGGRLWVKASAPWSAIYQTAHSTFTYVSDLPANAADDALAVLAATDGGRGAGIQAGVEQGGPAAAGSETSAAGTGAEPATERLQRGLRKMAIQLDKLTGHPAP